MAMRVRNMAVKPLSTFQSLADSEESPSKRPRIMNTPPDEANEITFTLKGPAETEVDRFLGNEGILFASWERLLRQIQEEVKVVTQMKSKIVPEIAFEDIRVIDTANPFLHDLKTRGVAIVRNVIPVKEAEAWSYDLDSYLRDNPHTKASPADNPELYELFWSLAQLNARAHPNMLAVQKFAMGGCWHHNSSITRERLSCDYPVTYADRVRMTHKSFGGSSPGFCKGTPPVLTSARIGDGGCEKREAEVYGKHSTISTYRQVWSGDWESYDPWNSSSPLDRTKDLHSDSSVSSVFKMFQGMLPLSLGSNDEDSHLRVCSIPLRLTSAYCLLRPLFSPKRPFIGSRDDFLDPSNWALDIAQSSLTPPRREIHDTTHPHLYLEETLLSLPSLNPGDYVIWHPDMIHSLLNTRPELNTPSPSPNADSCRPGIKAISPSPSTLLYIPACPLTQRNAEYLVHQRKAFLLGSPGPDFDSMEGGKHAGIGESYHMGRPGVQEINDAGGEEALRAMGLLAWDEDDTADEGERVLLKWANEALFPDRAAAR